MSEADRRWMQAALALGRRGMGRVWPNPAVGCVIVRDGLVVGRGWTQDGGRPHAEAMALQQAGSAAKGATVYVTLEPCAHTGKAPPCATALVKAKVARVVYACGDPDPRVNGAGAKMLSDAGIEVAQGVLRDQAMADHLGFMQRVTQGRPMMTLKLASSLDGRIATRTGDSQWITGPDARALVHKMRVEHDAILVGRGTVDQDDPMLDVRLKGLEKQSPVRVVFDTKARLSVDTKLVKTCGTTPVWLCHGPDAGPNCTALKKAGVRLLPCDLQDGKVDVTSALSALADQGITRVFCEGGGQLAASLIKAQVVDRLVTFQGGVAIGSDGLPNLGGLGVSTLSQAPRFTLERTTQIGPDVVHFWTHA